MAFLDNSGDILLDVVLTDEGRKRLAAGTFSAVKFALGDQEVNYGLYDKTNASGSAYFDLTLLSLPVEVAHTNASISLQTKLFTLGNNLDLLYLPQLKSDTKSIVQLEFATGRNAYALIADDETYELATNNQTEPLKAGYMDARNADNAVNTLRLRTPLGINDADAGDPITGKLDPVIDETQYSIIVDDRFIKLVLPGETIVAGGGGALQAGFGTSTQGSTIATPAARSNVFAGDDNLRVYDVTTSTEPTIFLERAAVSPFLGPSTNNVVSPSFVVQQTNQANLFSTYKTSTVTAYGGITGLNVDVIQTSMRVIGNSTGLSITVPLEIIKKS